MSLGQLSGVNPLEEDSHLNGGVVGAIRLVRGLHDRQELGGGKEAILVRICARGNPLASLLFLGARALFRCKVDGCVSQSQRVNLRIVGHVHRHARGVRECAIE